MNKTRNALKKPETVIDGIFIHFLLAAMGGGAIAMGYFQKIRGLMVSGAVLAGLTLLLCFVMVRKHFIDRAKFRHLQSTTNVVDVEIKEIRVKYIRLNGGGYRVAGYQAICEHDNKTFFSIDYKIEDMVKVGDIVKLYLPEEGVRDVVRREPGFDYYLDVFHIEEQ